MDFQKIESIVAEEELIYKRRKEQLVQEAQKLLEKKTEITFEDNTIIDSLRNKAIDMDTQVKNIQEDASDTMAGFDRLKFQKKNVEMLVNTLNGYLELERLKNELPIAIEHQDIEKCTKLAQVFNEIELVVLKEFCQADYDFVEKCVRDKLVHFQKEQYENAVHSNNLGKINLCAGLARVLHLEQSLDKLKEIHAKQYKKQLQKLEEEEFNKMESNLEKYEYPFANHFVNILSLIQPEQFVQNVQQFYGLEGVVQLLQYILSDICHPYLVGVLKKMNNFFDLDKQIKAIKPVIYDNMLLQSISQNKNIQLDNMLQLKITLFCDEIAEISNEYYSFIENIKDQLQIKQLSSQIEDSITEYLGKYLNYSQLELHQQIIEILRKSDSLNDLWNFDKTKFLPLLQIREPLLGNGSHEWLEELFFLIKNQIQRALCTNNQVIASAHINYIGFQVISEELYQIALQLFHRYLKKEYFSPTAIGISEEYTVNNSFIILLFNILSSIPTYLKTLKSQIYSNLKKGLSMVVGSVEEMIEANCKKFQKLIDEKIKMLVDFLRVRDFFDDARNLNFSSNETVMAEQEREYSKLFSGSFKNKLRGLNQWRMQLSSENYEQFGIQLGMQIARSLENMILKKQFHAMGAILLEKEIRSIINNFISATQPGVKQYFMKLQLICETLLLDSAKDMEEFLKSCATSEFHELKKLVQLRIDIIKPM